MRLCARTVPARIWAAAVAKVLDEAGDMVRDHVRHRRGGALVGDVLHLETGLLPECLTDEMAARSGPRRSEAHWTARLGRAPRTPFKVLAFKVGLITKANGGPPKARYA